MRDDRDHTLEERIAAAGDELSPAERLVAQYFVDTGEEVAFLPAAKIATALGVSNATVVRTAQRLGYSGLPELKHQLQAAALRRRMTPAGRLRRSLDELAQDGDAAFPEHFMTLQARFLAEAGRSLRPEEFDLAVGLLCEAGRVVVYAQGPYWPIAELFVTGLRRFGRRALAVGARAGQTAEDLLELGPGDVLLAVAYMRVTEPTVVVLERAREQQVPSVLVTDTLALALRGHVTVALSALRGEPGTSPTAIVPLAILEALLLGVGARDRDRTLAAIAKRDELTKKLR